MTSIDLALVGDRVVVYSVKRGSAPTDDEVKAMMRRVFSDEVLRQMHKGMLGGRFSLEKLLEAAKKSPQLAALAESDRWNAAEIVAMMHLDGFLADREMVGDQVASDWAAKRSSGVAYRLLPLYKDDRMCLLALAEYAGLHPGTSKSQSVPSTKSGPSVQGSAIARPPVTAPVAPPPRPPVVAPASPPSPPPIAAEPIEFECPNGHLLRSPGGLQGKTIRCPRCRVSVEIPAPSDPTEETISYKCRNCRSLLESPASLAGKTDECAVCKTPNQVPSPTAKATVRSRRETSADSRRIASRNNPKTLMRQYRKAIAYLDHCGRFTEAKLRKANRIAGDRFTEDDIRRMLSQASLILTTSDGPGGLEFLKATMRQNFEIALEGLAGLDQRPSPRSWNIQVPTWVWQVLVLVATAAFMYFLWCVRTIPPDQAIHSMAFSQDGTWLATAGQDYRDNKYVVKLRTLPDSETVRVIEMPVHVAPVVRMGFAAAGGRLLTYSGDRKIRLWNVDSGTMLQEWTAHEDGSWSDMNMALSKDGMVLATTSLIRDTSVKIWATQDGRLLGQPKVEDPVNGFALDPLGTRIAIVTDRGMHYGNARLQRRPTRLCVLDWKTEKVCFTALPVLGRQTGGSEVRYVQFSPDGMLLAVATGWGDKVWILNAADGQTIAELSGQAAFDKPVFSPDGRFLAGTADRKTVVVELASLKQVYASPQVHSATSVAEVAFSPDGRFLVSRNDLSRFYDGGRSGECRFLDIQALQGPKSVLGP